MSHINQQNHHIWRIDRNMLSLNAVLDLTEDEIHHINGLKLILSILLNLLDPSRIYHQVDQPTSDVIEIPNFWSNIVPENPEKSVVQLAEPPDRKSTRLNSSHAQ